MSSNVLDDVKVYNINRDLKKSLVTFEKNSKDPNFIDLNQYNELEIGNIKSKVVDGNIYYKDGSKPTGLIDKTGVISDIEDGELAPYAFVDIKSEKIYVPVKDGEENMKIIVGKMHKKAE